MEGMDGAFASYGIMPPIPLWECVCVCVYAKNGKVLQDECKKLSRLRPTSKSLKTGPGSVNFLHAKNTLSFKNMWGVGEGLILDVGCTQQKDKQGYVSSKYNILKNITYCIIF